MPQIIRIRDLSIETMLSGGTFPVDKDIYFDGPRNVNIYDLSKFILSGFTVKPPPSMTSGTSGIDGFDGQSGTSGTSGTNGISGTSGTSGTSSVTGSTEYVYTVNSSQGSRILHFENGLYYGFSDIAIPTTTTTTFTPTTTTTTHTAPTTTTTTFTPTTTTTTHIAPTTTTTTHTAPTTTTTTYTPTTTTTTYTPPTTTTTTYTAPTTTTTTYTPPTTTTTTHTAPTTTTTTYTPTTTTTTYTPTTTTTTYTPPTTTTTTYTPPTTTTTTYTPPTTTTTTQFVSYSYNVIEDSQTSQLNGCNSSFSQTLYSSTPNENAVTYLYTASNLLTIWKPSANGYLKYQSVISPSSNGSVGTIVLSTGAIVWQAYCSNPPTTTTTTNNAPTTTTTTLSYATYYCSPDTQTSTAAACGTINILYILYGSSTTNETNVTALYNDTTLLSKFIPGGSGYFGFKRTLGGTTNGHSAIMNGSGNITGTYASC